MFLKIKYLGNVNFVKICDPESEEFCANEIISYIVQQLEIISDCEIRLRDRDGAEIFLEYFQEILLQFKGCSWFFIELYLNGNSSESQQASQLESSLNYKELEKYIRSGDFHYIFEEFEKKHILSDNSRRTLVRESCNFLRQHCGNHPKRAEKIAIAEAIICLFPAFKVENSKFGGIDLFYNPENNSGYLAAKLKNLNTKLAKLGNNSNKKRKPSEVDNDSDDEAVISEEDLRFFKNCTISDELNLVKQKLRETSKARQKFMTACSNIFENFPIFLYDSSLIDFDFTVRYGEAISNGLLKNWEKYESCVEEILSNASGGSDFKNCTNWASDELPYLNLLKLLPSTASGRGQKKVNFQQSVNSFISFENINTPIAEYAVGSSQPTIIAVGTDRTKICQYFIAIDGKKINVPNDCKFSQVFDLYFKAFYLFNIKFEVSLANFLEFFAKFIYKIDSQKKASTRLLDVQAKFANKFAELTSLA